MENKENGLPVACGKNSKWMTVPSGNATSTITFPAARIYLYPSGVTLTVKLPYLHELHVFNSHPSVSVRPPSLGRGRGSWHLRMVQQRQRVFPALHVKLQGYNEEKVLEELERIGRFRGASVRCFFKQQEEGGFYSISCFL